MGALQLAFFCQLCKLRKSVSASVICAELAEVPWLRVSWTQVFSFMHRLAKMSEDSLHAAILRDNIQNAEHSPLVANWAGGIRKQFADLGMANPFPGSVAGTVDVLAFRQAMLSQEVYVWQGLHMSPRVALSPRAKLCTYFRWFARPDRVLVEPYYELPMSITKLRLLFHFRMGSHSLPVDQNRLARPGVPKHLRSYTFCPGRELGDERHCIFKCLHFDGHRLSFARLFDDAHDAMRTLVWHRDQKAVSALILAICTEAWTPKQIRPHRPLLAVWPYGRSESLSLIVRVFSFREKSCLDKTHTTSTALSKGMHGR